MLEKKIEGAVCTYAKKKGWIVYKFSSPGKRAVPDRMLLRDGSVFFIEFKATGGKPTPLQEVEIRKLRKAGFLVYVCDDIDEGKGIVDAISH